MNIYDDHAEANFSDPMESDADPLAFIPHTFGGIDGRCFGCDVRPGSRHSTESCIVW